MFAALWWKLLSKHSVYNKRHTEPDPLDYPVTSNSSNSHLWDPVTLFFFSTHSSYRLDKINSDIHNYITNFAADLRWIQLSAFPPLTSLMLPCCSGQTSEPAGLLPCWHTQYGCFTEQTLKTSQWEVIWGKLLLLANHKALLNTIHVWSDSLLYIMPTCQWITFLYSIKNWECFESLVTLIRDMISSYLQLLHFTAPFSTYNNLWMFML